jgi:hypothetical protein
MDDYQQAIATLRKAYNREKAERRGQSEKDLWKVTERQHFLSLLQRECKCRTRHTTFSPWCYGKKRRFERPRESDPLWPIHFKEESISLCHPFASLRAGSERSEGPLSGQRSFASLRMTILPRLRLTRKTSSLKWIVPCGRPVWACSNSSGWLLMAAYASETCRLRREHVTSLSSPQRVIVH